MRGLQSGKLKAEDRVTPKNPRYEGVRPQVNSGFNEIKFHEKFDLSKMNVRFRRDEHFRRLKTTTLGRFLSGSEEMEYLLLDLRDPADFQQCCILGALSYPAPALSRSVNNFTTEILEFRNRTDRMIIVYDYDERIAVPAANLFFEKGIDNVFLLSGGMKKFGYEYAELLEGELPRAPSPTSSTRSGVAVAPSVAASWRRSAPAVSPLPSHFHPRGAPPPPPSIAGGWK